MVALALVLGLSGCASPGPPGGEMQPLSAVPASKGRVFFYRDNTFMGGAVRPDILLNGQVVGVSRPGTYFVADVAPGTCEVMARTETTVTLSLDIRAGETHYIRSAISMGLLVGRIQFTQVTEQEARTAMEALGHAGVIPAAPSSGPGHPGAAPPPATPARPVTLEDLDGLMPRKQ